MKSFVTRHLQGLNMACIISNAFDCIFVRYHFYDYAIKIQSNWNNERDMLRHLDTIRRQRSVKWTEVSLTTDTTI